MPLALTKISDSTVGPFVTWTVHVLVVSDHSADTTELLYRINCSSSKWAATPLR